MSSSAPVTSQQSTSAFVFAFNPKGILPGQGPRELDVTLEHGTDGHVAVSYARLGPSFQLPAPVPIHRYRSGEATTPRLRGALDAVETALPTLIPALEQTPSDVNDVDNGYGWARGNSYELMTGAPAMGGTEYFYGTFGKDDRPAVAKTSRLLRDLAEALRHDA